MGRRELREHIFRLLFRIEFHKEEEMQEQIALYFDSLEEVPQDPDLEYIRKKYMDVSARVEEIDRKLDEVTEGWSVKRMGKVDLAVLRLAVYELLYDEDIPTGVAINEAVELCKKYGGEESPAFVNGVLAKLA
ncbi:transcription antitermination factor NusB [Diplocloster modestus]|uniref:Transcription antitermination protein NusB n=1 Tax=Diplocloster modestus TaxID=2850322 RepID=A0ABS6K3H3_9FIRM|nr:transcription antitermination factor NusB [Diplocloster modestus]MBU9725069.1 transcription antitermination factor NusB [Diplocloster modestus]